MDPCVNCGTVEPVVPVPSCDCQTLNPCGGDARETRLLAPTRHEHDEWAANNPILPEGVLGLVKDRLFEGSVEYIIGDGEHTYSELLEMYRIYAGAPLSRTGAANHSPLAAEGKSTLDPSWLPDATSSAKGAVMTSTTGAAGKVPITASGASTLDPSWLPAATSSTLGGVMTSLTGASGKVPIAGNSGQLDPSWLPEATSTALGAVKASTTKAANNVVKADSNGGLDGWKDSIIDAIIADDGSGGLITDDDGNLAVDFSQMPTDKFEALLKSLKMLIPLSSDIELIVDTNSAAAADTLIDGRGTEALPFKTIQAAVDYATSTYSVGSYKITIRVKNGTYSEAVTLPTYARTSGSIEIISYSRDQSGVIITPPTATSTGTRQTGFEATGGYWHISLLTVRRVENPTTATSAAPGCFQATGNGTTLNLWGVAAIQEMPSGVDFTGMSSYTVRMFEATLGATLNIRYSTTPGLIQCEKATPGPTVHVFSVSRSGVLGFAKNSTAGVVNCEGSCSTFLNMNQKGELTSLSSGSLIQFIDANNNFSGKRYALATGATGLGGLSTTHFPGDTAGTVDTDTFCWYNGNE